MEMTVVKGAVFMQFPRRGGGIPHWAMGRPPGHPTQGHGGGGRTGARRNVGENFIVVCTERNGRSRVNGLRLDLFE